MSLTLELTPDLEKMLARQAKAARMAPADYVRTLIARQPTTPAPHPVSGAEALAHWRAKGVLGLFADGPDSPELARELRDTAGRREW